MSTCTTMAARAVALAGAIVVSGCASARSTPVAAPSPFPRAPRPPASTTSRPPATPATWVDEAGRATRAPAGDALVQTALSLLGVAYRYGGEDPSTGLDCSGLVHYVFGQQGVDVPRTVDLQFDAGDRIDGSRLEAGDLIFFTTTGPGATHVGIALGPSSPGEFVHAPSTGGVVRIERYDSSYWRNRIVGYRRVLPASVKRPA